MFRRAFFLSLITLMLSAAAPARDVDIMTPFLGQNAMDMNSKILGQGIAFADGDRKKLDIYGPENPTGPAPVVMFTTSRGAFWAVVVYCLGNRDQEATAALLQALPQDVPDAYLTKLREAKTDGGKVWPFPVDV